MQSHTNAGNSRWQLIDPYGNPLFSSSFSSDVEVVTLTQSGDYALLLEGGISDSTAGAYTINVQPVTFATEPLEFNQPVNNSLSVSGEQDIYTFDGEVGQRVYFDRLAPSSFVILPTLLAPSGNSVFSFGSVVSDFGPFFLPETGTYQLKFDAVGDSTGDYGFRLYDVATVPFVSESNQLTGTLELPLGGDLFQIDASAGQKLVIAPRDDIFVGTAEQASRASGSLVAFGSNEDGYEAISAGLNLDVYRPGAAVNVILVSDEDRDVLDPSATFASTFTALDLVDARLNGVHDATFVDSTNRRALGVDSQGNAYLADGAGGFIASAGGTFVSTVRPGQTTKADYIDLAWALSGAAWDVNLLRGGGLPAESFTKAFVEVKADEIGRQLAIDLVASNSNAGFQNLTGSLSGIGPGEVANFDVQLTSDGTPQAFDLLFTHPGSNLILGQIPVALNVADYNYPVQAVDADGDVITFSLLTAPTDATIDSVTGRITWSPPGEGQYRFVVQADDGRGGRDAQDFEVLVTFGAANTNPQIVSSAQVEATTGLPFEYQVQATDADGDLLSYFLDQAPDGMVIDRESGRVSWTPTAAQIGPQQMSVRVLDGRGGSAAQSFTLNVGADTGNHPPQFVSTPLTTIPHGELYRYLVTANDQDNDPMSFDLVVAPKGMTVDATGAVVWRPVTDQVGDNNVILRVRDGRGGIALQSFQVAVTAPGTSPCFSTSAPSTDATVGRPYQYQFLAQDADGDSITFRLDSGPEGMTIDPLTGTLSWTPASDQVGTHGVVITAVDSHGLRRSLPFFLNVLASNNSANSTPIITSQPRTSIGLGATYLYQVGIADANSDPLMLTLQSAPAGMTLSADRMIQWTPANNRLGNNEVVLRLDDGRGGVASQSFTIAVTSTRSNALPQITSSPILTTVVGRHYEYELQGEDLDRDPLFWSLVTAPRGMSIHELLGTICWMPEADQVGPAEVMVRVDDGQGGFSTQSFTIDVRAVNLPPAIVSSPVTEGAANRLYLYQVQAVDPDGDTLSYSLSTRPTGMTIDPLSGEISWIPTSGQIGNSDVVVNISDGQGGLATQQYRILISSAPANQPPTITTTPTVLASADMVYRYAAVAIDPEGDALTFALLTPPAGMTIDPTTGVLLWTPTVSQVGNHAIRLTATDTVGNIAGQSFTLSVQSANHPPVIRSSPLQLTTPESNYRYDVWASDPDGNQLRYRLTSAPEGMSIDSLGRIAWRATTDLGSHPISVEVMDSFGASAIQSFELLVEADTELPSLYIDFESPAERGTSVVIFVSATDNVGIVNLVLTVDGIPLAVDAAGRAEFVADQVGTFEVVATASDAAGNSRTVSSSLLVVDNSDPNAPGVEIASPSDGAVITSPVSVLGTVNDTNLLLYKLEVALLGSSSFTEIAHGTAPVANGVLGTIDPTMLQNDTYVLRLTAVDTAGNSASTEQTIHVEGNLKLGNFNLSFVDLTIPVFGVPISVGRTYDTLNAAQSDDFGFGWRLEFRNMDLRTSVTANPLEAYGIYNPFKVGSRVYVTLPGGERQGFTFRPNVASGFRGSFLGIFEPHFVPDAGVKSSLTVVAADLRIRADGTVYDYSTGAPFNPAAQAFGGSYLLTTKDGIAYDIDANSGQLTALSDPTNNVLQFTRAGISGPDGTSVSFERDPQDRIVAVVDPAGNRIHYQYNVQGDLVAVTDRMGNTTQFNYRATPSHYLDAVVDPLGHTGVRTEYDSQGRLIKLLDSAGNLVQFSYDPTQLINTFTDPLGNKTTEIYDERGNTLQHIDALGAVTLRTFDFESNLLTETDPLGRTTSFTYNNRGDVLTKTDALGNTTFSMFAEFTFGTSALSATRGEAAAPFSRISTLTDALGNTTTIEYNRFGNLTSTTDPNGNVVVVNYDRPSNPPTAITDSLGKTTQYETINGMLVREIDALGHAIAFTYDGNNNRLSATVNQTALDGSLRVLTSRTEYDANGRVITTTNPDGGITRIEYDANGNRTTTIDTLGRRTVYLYDYRNNLIETILPDDTPDDLADNPRQSIVYDAAGRVISRIDELGQSTTYRYDAVGRRISTINPDGTFTQTKFDAAGQTIELIDELGNRTVLEYDANGLETSRRDALGGVTTTTYDAAGRSLAVTNTLGLTTTFVRDAVGRRIETTNADGSSEKLELNASGQVDARIDELGNITRYQRDALGRVVAIIDALGNPTNYTYDEQGNLLATVLNMTAADGTQRALMTQNSYDALGRLTMTIDAEGGVTQHEYDAAGNRTATVDALRRRTEFVYDDRDQLVETIYPDNTPADPLDNPRSFFVYDATHNLVGSIDELGRQTTYLYDFMGRLEKTIYADGATEENQYDASGQISARIDARGNRTEYQYDSNGQLVSQRDALGIAQSYVYDVGGRRIADTDALGHTTHFEYDSRHQLIRTTFADGTFVAYTYDAHGQLIEQTDQLGRKTRYEYDAVGNNTAVVDALNQRSEYAFDEVGNLVSQKDANGHITRYEYDALGRRTSTQLPLGQLSLTTFDATGNVVSIRDFDGQTVNYDYDSRNRLLSKNFPDSSAVLFAYTLTGQPSSVTEGRGITTYTYDDRDRLLTRTDPDGSQVTYDYDLAGNRTTLTTILGAQSQSTVYVYDALNRIETVTDPEAGATVYTYDAIGNLAKTELPNGTTETREYDILNRLIFIENRGPAGVISSQSYTLGATGRRDAVVENDGRRVNYAFDGLDRIIEEEIVDSVLGDRTFDYSYDAVGNRLSLVDSSEGRTEFVYDANDRLVSDLANGQTTLYQYDDNGNMLGRSNATDSVFYHWDFENRLISADTNGDGTVDVEYEYDTSGNRVSQTHTGEETRYLIDTVQPYTQVLLEYRPDGLVICSYVYGNGLISQSREGAQLFTLVDGLGSARVVADANSTILNRYVYDAFGRILHQDGSATNNYLFAGQQRDFSLGLDYLRARYYDPTLGRFISTDPLRGLFANSNALPAYTYVGNNPVNRIDPTGLIVFTLTETQAGALLGGILGAIEGGINDGLSGALKGFGVGALFGLASGFAIGRIAASAGGSVAGASAGGLLLEEATVGQTIMANLPALALIAGAGGVTEGIITGNEGRLVSSILGLFLLGASEGSSWLGYKKGSGKGSVANAASDRDERLTRVAVAETTEADIDLQGAGLGTQAENMKALFNGKLGAEIKSVEGYTGNAYADVVHTMRAPRKILVLPRSETENPGLLDYIEARTRVVYPDPYKQINNKFGPSAVIEIWAQDENGMLEQIRIYAQYQYGEMANGLIPFVPKAVPKPTPPPADPYAPTVPQLPQTAPGSEGD
ncbi:MAG: putative Ig domain-containing protein [Planctomycetales bacterium]|nr:putative Ig domain-containing protein [Planctomycetales bacterium]